MKIFNSNRTGHVAAAFGLGLGALAASLALGDYYLALSAVTVPLWELWGTCDNDIDTRSPRRGPWIRRLWVRWWKPYALRVTHRSRWSHSLLFGLPYRLWHGLLPLWVLLAALALLGMPMGWFAPGCWYALFGCAVADTLHMVKDGFGIGKILFGR